MDKAGSQRKRPNVWHFGFRQYESTDTPTKSNFLEKRRLSLRSENTSIVGTTTPQSSSSLFRQATGLTHIKQPGKENESPFSSQDHDCKLLRARIAKSTTKRTKSSNPTICITDSEKKIVRRRLSGDYEDQLSSSKLYRAKPIERIIFTSEVTQPSEADVNNRHAVMTKFCEYVGGKHSTTTTLSKFMTQAVESDGHEVTPKPDNDFEKQVDNIEQQSEGILPEADYAQSKDFRTGAAQDDETVPANEDPRTKSGSQEIFENDTIAIPGGLHYLWKSYQRYKLRGDDRTASTSGSAKQSGRDCVSSASQKSASGEPESSNARSTDDLEISNAEFRIERVDRDVGGISAMNYLRKVKSGSDIKWLNAPLRTGGDISPLKRRMNEFKRFRMIKEKSCGVNKKRKSLIARRDDNLSDSEMALKSKSITSPGNDNMRKRKYDSQISTIDPSTGAISKTNRHTNPEVRQTIENIIESYEIPYTGDFVEETIELEHAREGYCHKISKTFLEGKAVTPEQRRIVVNFLISVHAYLSTSTSTLHQATKIFDAILDIKDVSVEELQLVALGALWIAIKNMETKIPTASEMISFAKDMYRTEGPGLLCQCERKILKTLGFKIRFPDPVYISAYYLQRWSSLETVPDEPSIFSIVCDCAGYLMDVALADGNYSKMPGELLAAATTQTAADLALSSLQRPMEQSTRPNINKFTRYTHEEIDRVIGPLLQAVLDSAVKDSPIGAVYKKYKNGKYDNTGDYLVTRIKQLSGLTCPRKD